jgi:hypothetical protein
MGGRCKQLDGANCYYGGSALNAMDAFYTLVNGGGDALWGFLEDYYRTVFQNAPYPKATEYPMAPRKGA